LLRSDLQQAFVPVIDRSKEWQRFSAEAELLSLLCPVNREVCHPGNPQTARQSAINRSLHNVRDSAH
jgi:hypothetical protein